MIRNYMLCHKLQQEHPEKEEPPLAKVFTESRRRDSKKEYKTSFVKTKDNVEQMEALVTQANGEGSNQGDPYYQVIKKPEHSGHLRLFGQGVTKSDLKKKGKKSSYIFPQELMQSIQTDLIEMLQEANPEVSFVIPESVKGNSSNGTKAKSRSDNLEGGQSSFSTYSTYQVQVDQPNGPIKEACVVNDQTMEK